MRSLFAVLGLVVIALTAACDSSSHPNLAPDGSSMSGGAGQGGATGTGGSTAIGTGGMGGSGTLTATGGVVGSGGSTATGGTTTTGGAVASGGASGGTTGSGGVTVTVTGGARASGGTTSSGGVTGTGGTRASGGRTSNGGVTGSGGTRASGGTTGNGGNSSIAAPADNVAELSADFGLAGIGYVNGLFVTVTVCVPGTSQCQSIDHVLVDTGSTGLRLLGSVLTLPLPASTDDSGVALAQCLQFVSSNTWGGLRSADLKIAGEQAKNLVIQVIDESVYPVPSDCTGVSSNTADTLRCNGIIGVGSFLQDCGAACALPVGGRSANPGMYYKCSSTAKGGCKAAAVPISKQLWNPIALFSQDNNGTIIELPAVPAEGAASVTGALVFGIGTRDNNALGQAKVLPLDSIGTFLTRYPANGNSTLAFIDSGSNAIFFLDTKTAGIPACTGLYSSFYCPTSTQNLSATSQDANGLVTMTMNFSIANARTLFASPTSMVFANLGGPSVAPSSGGSSMGAYFDWGLPFYFGRNVFTSIEDQAGQPGTGLYVAF